MTEFRTSAAELRRFGLTVGAAFAAIGAYWIWREKFPHVSVAFVATGAILLVAAAFAPRSLAIPQRAWMVFGERVSAVMTRVILFILFYAVVTPIGIILRLTGRDLLGRRHDRQPTYWTDYSSRQRDRRHYDKMY